MQEKTSRLAGAGGAAECALMNAQRERHRREAHGGEAMWRGVHEAKFTSKSSQVQNQQLFVESLISWGLNGILFNNRI
jgi:hypothetical protein